MAGLAGLVEALAAGHTVLAPNTELAAALFAAVERHYQDAGYEVWLTPKIRDFSSWLREQQVERQLKDANSPRILGPTDERELWRAVIDSSDLGAQILETSSAVRAAQRAHRALYEYGIPVKALVEHAAVSEESRAFLDWSRGFDERCKALDCIGADGLLALTAPPIHPIVWIESPLWRPVVRRWLMRHGKILVPVDSAAQSLCRLNPVSPTAELAAIAEWSMANLRSNENFRAWICVPDLSVRREEVVDAMDAVLAPQRFELSDNGDTAPYAIAGGTPLAEFAPVRAALDILAASTALVSFERFSALLRAPEWHASTAEAGAVALLDLLLRRRGPSEAELSIWLALAERLAAPQGVEVMLVLQRFQNTVRVLNDLRGGHPMSRWVPVWITALESGPWALRHRWSSVEYQAAERFRELLGQLATADSILGSHSRSSAQRILRRAANDTPFQVQTGIPPIWISSQLSDPWLNYDGLWVSSCSDDRWPPRVEPIALLPVGLQREFGVVAAAPETQLQFALDLQTRWVARARECMFSYADPGDGRSATPSPLLPDSVLIAAPALPRPHWHTLKLAAPVLEQINDELAPPFSQDERTRGVSTLKAQSRCAFRGFAETRLGTERLERPVPGFNDRERGELIHHALEYIWSHLRTSHALLSIAADAQNQLLGEATLHALEKICRVRDPGPRWRLREQERMSNVLHKWLEAERQRAPFAVEQIEQGTRMARHAGLDFAVRIDRVDRLDDGSRVVIDYKTGIAAVDWRGERPDNPQLPIYALLHPHELVAVAYGRVNAADCSFVAEVERPAIFKPRGQKSSLEGMPDFAALLAVWSRRMEALAADFAAGRAAVAPTLRACKTCHLQGLCRVPSALEETLDSHG